MRTIPGRILVVISPCSRRGNLTDSSSLLERAAYIGRIINIAGKNAVIIDALRHNGIWYLHYSEIQ